jgi:hypothetical protein
MKPEAKPSCKVCRDKLIVPAPAKTPPFMPCPECCRGAIICRRKS